MECNMELAIKMFIVTETVVTKIFPARRLMFKVILTWNTVQNTYYKYKICDIEHKLQKGRIKREGEMLQKVFN